MLCPRCRTENREGRRFCSKCGAALPAACSSCGFTNESGDEFCGGCGARLGAPQPAQSKFTSPDTYTPKHLAEKILTSKAALEGERKQVTILFADLKGSMELLADRDPEEARKLLDPVIEHMMEAVHRYEGTVNQVMGDGIMALFGAPLAHEDHAVRACYAALRMQGSVAQYAEGVFRSHGVPVQIRVGLNSGEVVVRAIGSDLHMDYTAVGQTTHLAARMEQMAAPGTILLAPSTLRLTEGYVEVAARGPVVVKGVPDPVEVHALTGASAHRTRLHAAAARGLTRFVGRDAEVEQIRRALALAHDGHGQLVAIVGEPGVGKSRLVYEFTHSHRAQSWLILEAGSVSYGKATSCLPVIDVLKTYFKVHERETHREIREKVTGKLLTLDRTLEPILPALLTLLDVPVDDPRWQALDPPQRRKQTLDAVKHLLLRESQDQPLLVVFEDLHWIDAETQTLVDSSIAGASRRDESEPSARAARAPRGGAAGPRRHLRLVHRGLRHRRSERGQGPTQGTVVISFAAPPCLVIGPGMRPLVAHCHLGLGKLYRHTGKWHEAQEHLTTATMLYRELDMRFWLEQAEARWRASPDALSAVPARESAAGQILPGVCYPVGPALRELCTPLPASASSASSARIPSARPNQGGRQRRLGSPRLTPTPPSISPKRSSPRRPPWKASASRSPCSSPTSRARWSCSPTAIPRRRARFSTLCWSE